MNLLLFSQLLFLLFQNQESRIRTQGDLKDFFLNTNTQNSPSKFMKKTKMQFSLNLRSQLMSLLREITMGWKEFTHQFRLFFVAVGTIALFHWNQISYKSLSICCAHFMSPGWKKFLWRRAAFWYVTLQSYFCNLSFSDSLTDSQFKKSGFFHPASNVKIKNNDIP